MFYFENINEQKVLRSDLFKKANAFFTTRDSNLLSIFDYAKKADIANRFIKPEQTHSSNVQVVDSRELYSETDGLIISNSKTLIYLKFADCTPLIFYDPIMNIGAVSHAGWRGTASKIGVRTVEKMAAEYGSKVENIRVLIGPAIGQCCYEVSEDVRDNLISTVSNSAGLYNGRHVDLKRINAEQLREAGVKYIDICPYCTSCNNDLFYSYRKEHGTEKRHYAVIVL